MKSIFHLLSFSLLVLLVSSCVDREFDEPPFPMEDTIDVPSDQILSIRELLSLRPAGQEFLEVNRDEYLKGVVVADDQSGNFFKSLVVQDGSSGITILLDDVELWNQYFVGKELFIHLENMWLGDFNGLPQIGFEPVNGSMARIPAELIDDVITRGETVPSVTPQDINISDISDNMLNTLVTISDVQFASGSDNAMYALSATTTSVNHFVEDCNGNEVILRSSGFASFADELTPSGNGSIVGVLGKFGSDFQLLIRDPRDVTMEDVRCDGSGGTTTGTGGEDPVFVIDFEGQNDRDDFAIGGWLNVATEGTRVWQKREFDSNGYGQLSAFQDDAPMTEAWLISPEIVTSERGTISFRTANSFFEHDALEVLYSDNFEGAINNAQWQSLGATIALESTGANNWLESGDIDLTALGSEIHIAFKYSGDGVVNTTTFRVDDINIR